MSKLRRFTKQGNEIYKNFFLQKIEDETTPVPYALLDDKKLTELVSPSIDVDARDFQSRYEFGKYLVEVLSPLEAKEVREDFGLWNWIALLYFDKIYPTPRGAKETIKYVLSENHRGFWYRNLVRCPWDVVQKHGEAGRVLLTKGMNTSADEVETCLSSKYIRTTTSLLQVLESLYYVPEKSGGVGNFKSGHGQTKKTAPGSYRRFDVVISQLANTWDFHSMTAGEVIDLLPPDLRALAVSKKMAA